MTKRLPSMNKLLLLGDTSISEALGSKLLRGLKSSVLSEIWEVELIYNSPAVVFSPSMRTICGKIFYRLADKRSREWWLFRKKLEKKIKHYKPDLVLVTGILPLQKKIFKLIHEQNGLIANYMTDNPWNPIHKRKLFLKNIKMYDHIFSTKKKMQEKLLKAGAVSTSWLPFAYDPFLHYPVRTDYNSDVVFIGTGAKERLRWLKPISKIENIRKQIYGNNWEKISTPGWEQKPACTGENYCNAIASSRVVLGLLRAGNEDESTDRSFEIGAIGGCGLYQDTCEHRELLNHYPDEGFFKDPNDLKKKVESILANDSLQLELREIGKKLMKQQKNTYSARIETILDWANR